MGFRLDAAAADDTVVGVGNFLFVPGFGNVLVLVVTDMSAPIRSAAFDFADGDLFVVVPADTVLVVAGRLRPLEDTVRVGASLSAVSGLAAEPDGPSAACAPELLVAAVLLERFESSAADELFVVVPVDDDSE